MYVIWHARELYLVMKMEVKARVHTDFSRVIMSIFLILNGNSQHPSFWVSNTDNDFHTKFLHLRESWLKLGTFFVVKDGIFHEKHYLNWSFLQKVSCMRCKSYVHLKTKKVELDYQNEFKLGEYYTTVIEKRRNW